ncbi:MAG: hypothetical protein K1X29_11535 [Bdellovibrionales bacterium]|nr:hypothetical protein [Bdellovibrionales bacterium]
MKLSERSYSGKLFLPRPEILCEANGDLCIITFPWGQRTSARKAIKLITEIFHSSQNADDEMTSPFQYMTCLSPLANNLRTAVMLANDVIYREENKSEYLSGVELLVVAKKSNEIVFARIGGPALFLNRKKLPLLPLDWTPDLSLQYSHHEEWLPPLPSHLLGVASTSNFSIQSHTLQPGDQWFLIHRSIISPKVLTLKENDLTISKVSHTLALHSPQMPFWLGILQFDDISASVA